MFKLTVLSHSLFSHKLPSYVFDWVLDMPQTYVKNDKNFKIPLE